MDSLIISTQAKKFFAGIDPRSLGIKLAERRGKRLYYLMSDVVDYFRRKKVQDEPFTDWDTWYSKTCQEINRGNQ